VVTEQVFNPFDFLNPFNPFALLLTFIFLVTPMTVISISNKRKSIKFIAGGIALVIFSYFAIPNIYIFLAWIFVEKIHMLR
jgi:hypothetical protein